MNQKEKNQLIQWMRNQRYEMRDGGKLALDDIIKDSRNKFTNPTDLVIPRLMDAVHPWLYFNYVLDWTNISTARIPVSYRDGAAFGSTVIKDWQCYCARTKMFRSGLLEDYQNVEQLRKATEKLLSDHKVKFYIKDDDKLQYMEQQLCLMREADRAREAEAEAQRLAEEEARRSQLEAEAQRRRQQEEADRRKAEEAHRETAEHNAAFHDKDGSPWTADPSESLLASAPQSPADSGQSYSLLEADLRTLQHDLSIFIGRTASIAIGYKGSNYEMFCDMPAPAPSASFSAEHLHECISLARARLTEMTAAAREQAERQKQKAAIEAKLQQLLAEADNLRKELTTL